MKCLVLIIALIPLILFSQQGIELYGNYNQPIHNSYVDYYNDFKRSGNQIDLSNFNIGINAQVFRNKHFSLRLGLNYKFIDLILRDEIDSVAYQYFTVGSHGSTTDHSATYHYKRDSPDLHNQSNNLGLNIDFKYLFYENSRNSHGVGTLINLYFFEFFKTYYQSTELDELRNTTDSEFLIGEKSNPLLLYQRTYLSRNFFVSAVDLQLYYQYTLNFSKNFSLGFRASIGTNLYSDWNQFKKYVWVGFGVNFGFLSNEKVRVNKKMPLGEVEKKESM